MLTKEKAQEIAQDNYLKALPAGLDGVDPDNPCKELLNIVSEEETNLSNSKKPEDQATVIKLDTKADQAIHDCWCHPCETKMIHIIKYYKGKGFPTGFLKALRNFTCKICGICKGASKY